MGPWYCVLSHMSAVLFSPELVSRTHCSYNCSLSTDNLWWPAHYCGLCTCGLPMPILMPCLCLKEPLFEFLMVVFSSLEMCSAALGREWNVVVWVQGLWKSLNYKWIKHHSLILIIPIIWPIIILTLHCKFLWVSALHYSTKHIVARDWFGHWLQFMHCAWYLLSHVRVFQIVYWSSGVNQNWA